MVTALSPSERAKTPSVPLPKSGSIDGELVMPVQEDAHLRAAGPDPNAHLAGGARGNVAAASGGHHHGRLSSADAVGAHGAVTGQGDAVVIVGRVGAVDQPVIVLAEAQARAGRDLGVEVADHRSRAQAEHADMRLADGKGDAVAGDDRAALVGLGGQPGGGVGKVVGEDERRRRRVACSGVGVLTRVGRGASVSVGGNQTVGAECWRQGGGAPAGRRSAGPGAGRWPPGRRPGAEEAGPVRELSESS